MSTCMVRAIVVFHLAALSCATAQTNLPLPPVFVTPDSVEDRLPPGGTSEHPLVLANLGEAPLDFSVALSDGTPPGFGMFDVVTTECRAIASMAAGDMDGDGDDDILWIDDVSGALGWWENAGDGSSWEYHAISTNELYARTVIIADVEGDGDNDVIVLTWKQIVWWENLDGHGRQWSRAVAYPGTDPGLDIAAADLDGDGDMDLVSMTYFSDSLFWLVNKDGHGRQWELRAVGMLDFGMSVATADMDRDGDTDIVASGFRGITWWENTAGNGNTWLAHPVKTAMGYTWKVVPADMDMDGDLDLVSASSDGGSSYGEYAWWKNVDGLGRSWTKTSVIKQIPDPGGRGTVQGLLVADFDGDGYPDVLGSSRIAYDMWWWKNLGAGTAWQENRVPIRENPPVGYIVAHAVMQAADLDGDGDSEIVHAMSRDGIMGWFENETAPPWVRVHPQTGSVATGCQAQVMLRLDATDLPAGCVVSGRATFACNDPRSPITHVPVVLNVVDTNPPHTAITITPPANEHGWHNTNVSIALVATDAESGVASIRYVLDGTPTIVPGDRVGFDIADEGRHSLAYGATDTAGNEEPLHDAYVWLDRTPPGIILTLVRRAANPYRCQLLFRVTDNLSGVESAEAGLKTPDIGGYSVRLQTTPSYMILIDTKKRDVKIHAPDPNAVLDQLRGGLLQLASGQDLRLRLTPGSKHWRIWRTGRMLNVEAPLIAFTAAANDYAHNAAEARASLEQVARKPAFLELIRALGLARTL